MTSGVLQGIRVLDFGRYIAGPYCAALLGDLGAEVVRVERVAGSEDRFLMPLTPNGDGAMFLQCNRGKLGMTLDPVSTLGREVTRRLVRTADVVVANLPRAQLVRMGLDYDSLIVENPGVVLTMITAFGVRGAKADSVGFDGIGQAMSGAMYLSGKSGEPAKAVANYVDFTTALGAALGTVAALFERRTTGKGQIVDSSLLASGLTLMNASLIEEAVLATGRFGTGNRSQFSGPSDTFQTRDGFVLVQTVGDPLFERWANLMGEPQWVKDPRFAGDTQRGAHGNALSDRMQAWCGERTTAEALAALEAAKIPSAKIHSPRDALGDPTVMDGGFFEPSRYPGIAPEIPVARAPFGMSSGSSGVRGRAPTLGEHTERLLSELGFDAREIDEMRRAGAI